MAIGEVYDVPNCADLHYVDTGMYDVPEYGSVYIVDAERPALVDTGIGANYERVLAAMREVGVAPEELEVIALTHVHLDHAGGAGYLVEVHVRDALALDGVPDRLGMLPDELSR